MRRSGEKIGWTFVSRLWLCPRLESGRQGWLQAGPLLVCLWRHKATQDLVPGFSPCSPRRLLADQGPVLSRSRRHQHVGAQTGSRHPHPRHRRRQRLHCRWRERGRLRGSRCLRGGDWRLELLIMLPPSVDFIKDIMALIKVSLCNNILHGQFFSRSVSFRNGTRAYQNWNSITYYVPIWSDYIFVQNWLLLV